MLVLIVYSSVPNTKWNHAVVPLFLTLVASSIFIRMRISIVVIFNSRLDAVFKRLRT